MCSYVCVYDFIAVIIFKAIDCLCDFVGGFFSSFGWGQGWEGGGGGCCLLCLCEFVC